MEPSPATPSTCALYVHIPYCQTKCPYCDFNSYAASEWPETRYTDALCRELTHAATQPEWAGKQIQTIFFGGGTPSLFAPTSIARVLDTVRAHWPVAATAEITLEANPGTVSLDTLAGFRDAGINRLSFGVQSFTARHLRTLGRIHSAEDAVQAVEWGAAAGFDNINVDCMYALPQQTCDEWRDDLQRACDLGATHISAYNLTYEEGTAFYQWRTQGRLHNLPEETEITMFTHAQDTLATHGYAQYEISNYASPGKECQHNLNYWHSGAYLGVGAGAHTYSGVAAGTHTPWGQRWGNVKSPTRYMQLIEHTGAARDTTETLSLEQAQGEFVFLALRCTAGFSDATFTARFGQPFPQAFVHVAQFVHDGWLIHEAGHWSLTPKGRLLADTIFASFL